jgi:signal transduction histidine kinase
LYFFSTTSMGTNLKSGQQSRRALPAAEELTERTGWLIRMRWLAIAGVVCTIEIARRFFPLHLALTQIYCVLSGLVLYNSAMYLIARRLRYRQAGRIPKRSFRLLYILMPRVLRGLDHEAEALQASVFAFVQISVDLLALAMLLHFSGGIENPFVYFFIFHGIVSGILLSRLATYFQATLGLILVSVVAMTECSGLLHHYPLDGIWRPEAYRDPMLVGAQLFVFGTTLYVSVYMAGDIAVNLRNRQRDVFLLWKEVARETEMLDAAFNKLSALEQAKSQYMRKVSHELCGPLGTIQTALKVILQGVGGQIPDQSRDLLSRAERRAGELEQMICDLLVLSQAKDAYLSAEKSAVMPGQVLAGVVEDMTGVAEEAGVTLSADFSRNIAMTEADEAGLRQMVRNLLSNAIRYTPRGGKVSASLRVVDNALRWEVQDTGIGIPDEDLSRIFEEFFRSTNAREYTRAGTGLCLAIVKAVVEQHGGTVSVQSTLGQGTRFTVYIPLSRDTEAGNKGEGNNKSQGRPL